MKRVGHPPTFELVAVDVEAENGRDAHRVYLAGGLRERERADAAVAAALRAPGRRALDEAYDALRAGTRAAPRRRETRRRRRRRRRAPRRSTRRARNRADGAMDAEASSAHGVEAVVGEGDGEELGEALDVDAAELDDRKTSWRRWIGTAKKTARATSGIAGFAERAKTCNNKPEVKKNMSLARPISTNFRYGSATPSSGKRPGASARRARRPRPCVCRSMSASRLAKSASCTNPSTASAAREPREDAVKVAQQPRR